MRRRLRHRLGVTELHARAHVPVELAPVRRSATSLVYVSRPKFVTVRSRQSFQVARKTQRVLAIRKSGLARTTPRARSRSRIRRFFSSFRFMYLRVSSGFFFSRNSASKRARAVSTRAPRVHESTSLDAWSHTPGLAVCTVRCNAEVTVFFPAHASAERRCDCTQCSETCTFDHGLGRPGPSIECYGSYQHGRVRVSHRDSTPVVGR